MSRTHTVKAGESIASLAAAAGHFPNTVWNHPDNASLKADRINMNTLAVGDRVFIPDARPKTVEVKTDKVHRFRRRGVPATLRLQLRRNGKPRKETPYRLEFAGMTDEGTTDADGILEAFVPPSVREIRLYVGNSKRARVLAIGHLEPATATEGLQQRLRNLGFDAPSSGELDAATRAAVAAFQRGAEFEADGDATDETIEAIRQAHDRTQRSGQ